MKKIVVFSGAGLDNEPPSNIPTFRDNKTGYWFNYEVNDVATAEAWKKNKGLVLEFHNKVRQTLLDKKPNAAHKMLVELERNYEVIHITQNISNLLELANATKVLHLHGELLKSRSTLDSRIKYECLGDINLGDKCEKGSQLRPDTVLFGEFPYYINESYKAIRGCDYLLIVGTSLSIGYTVPMLAEVNDKAEIYYIDPEPSLDLDYIGINVKYIKKKAIAGVNDVVYILNNK